MFRKVRMTWMVGLVAALVVILGAACGGGATAPKTSLESMLGLVPLVRQMPDGSFPIIYFSDVRMIKEAYGISDRVSLEAFFEKFPLDDVQVSGIAHTIIQYPFSGTNPVKLDEEYGYNFLSPERTIFVDSPPASVGVMEGPFVEAVLAKLPSLGYQESSYQSARLFSNLLDDFEIDLRSELRFVLNKLNRIAVEDRRMVGAPATALVEEAVDVWNGDRPGAASDSSLQELARGLGDVMNAMLFRFTEAQLIDLFDPLYSEMASERRELLLETMVGSYTPLHSYDWMGSAITLRDGEAISLLALHYPDREAAEDDREELLRRMRGYESLAFRGMILFEERCPSLDATAETVGTGSVLVVACKGTSLGHRTFMEMVFRKDVAFLLPDPATVLD